MKAVIVAALVAAAVSAGGSFAGTKYIDGHTIRPRSVPLNRLIGLPRGDTKVVHVTAVLGAYASGSVAVTCPSGWKLLTGGFIGDGSQVTASYPNSGGWEVLAKDQTGFFSSYTSYAMCGR